MRVVIDTNCLLASIPPLGAYYWLYAAFEQERFEWAVSNEVLTEYEEKITMRYSNRTAHLVLTILTFSPNVLFFEPYYHWQLIEEDPDDNKFVDLAVSAGVDYLITNDRDFKILKKVDFPKINVLNLDEFKAILG
ncbi:MAG: putative toxin-antitoxin system toxin component, PIN family [Spirosomataceae bacterium]